MSQRTASSGPKVAIGALFIECNHLGGVDTTLDFFERTVLRRDEEVLALRDGTVGGALSTLEGSASLHPLVAALACPSGPLTADCYTQLKSEMLERLEACDDLDGVLMVLHGSAAAANAGDLEGDLLKAIRDLVGPDVPIVATLDLHAHVTEAMVLAADALVAWETYPHRDAFSTGERGARLLLGILDGSFRPAMALAKAPVIVGGVHSGTEGDAPFADVMRLAKSFEAEPTVLSTSAFLVHPYLDLPDMGGGGLVITDDDLPLAVDRARQIAEYYWQRRFDLEADVITPSDAIQRGLKIDGDPVLLAEVADTCGGGAAGDNVTTLRALLEAGCNVPTLVPVVDPAAAARCNKSGVGSEVTLQIGHALDPQWGQPLELTGTVRRLSDGRFDYTGGMYEGQVGHMGPSAVLEVGSIQILITTHATYDWSDEQFRSMELDTDGAKFIVVKNPMNFRVGYAGRYREFFILDTPGSTPGTLRNVRFKRLERPYFPADTDIPDFEPTIVEHPA